MATCVVVLNDRKQLRGFRDRLAALSVPPVLLLAIGRGEAVGGGGTARSGNHPAPAAALDGALADAVRLPRRSHLHLRRRSRRLAFAGAGPAPDRRPARPELGLDGQLRRGRQRALRRRRPIRTLRNRVDEGNWLLLAETVNPELPGAACNRPSPWPWCGWRTVPGLLDNAIPRRIHHGLPHKALFEKFAHPEELEPVIAAASRACAAGSLSGRDRGGYRREEAEQRFGHLADLDLQSWGGFAGRGAATPAAAAQRSGAGGQDPAGGLLGLEISGNFLFDPAERRPPGRPAGGRLPEEDLGDLWLRGDRGGQTIVTAAAAERLDAQQGLVRSVEVRLEARPLDTCRCQPGAAAPAHSGRSVPAARCRGLSRLGPPATAWSKRSAKAWCGSIGNRSAAPARAGTGRSDYQWKDRGELEIPGGQSHQRGRIRIGLLRR